MLLGRVMRVVRHSSEYGEGCAPDFDSSYPPIPAYEPLLASSLADRKGHMANFGGWTAI